MTSTTPNPMEGLPPASPVSKRTMHMTGLLVDVYGLDELPPTATRVSCLWLHHPRLGTKEAMADIAARAVAAWNGYVSGGRAPRGLIAVAFDQRNHGSRMVWAEANEAWRHGNRTHAQDMFGTIAGTVADTRVLMDALEGYVLHDLPEGQEGGGKREKKRVDQHLVLGVSLGGHSGWQLLFADERVSAAVIVVGCPDYAALLTDRARLSKRDSYNPSDSGAAFLGSGDFPPALVAAVERADPKGILFGASAPVPQPPDSPSASDAKERARLRGILDARLRGKKILACSGADDKLVPYRCGEAFLGFLKDAAGGWYRDGGLVVEDRVYAGTGHVFSTEMVADAVRFVVDVVGGAGEGGDERGGAGQERRSPAKI